MTYAGRHWQESIYWNRADSEPFLESMARMFWAQTIAAPYAWGSESIAKCMLALTARYHNQELIYRSGFVFRMPFATSPEEFVDYFKANVCLKHDLSEGFRVEHVCDF